MSDKSSGIQNLTANIKKGVQNYALDLHTAMPGIIESFDAVKQTASVQPAVRRIFKRTDGEDVFLVPEALPLLINVPVQFPRGGGFSLTFPVTKGDECLLVFCERSIDNWHQYGGLRDPAGKRFHHLSDATAFVGLSSVPNKVPDYSTANTELKKDDDSVRVSLTPNGQLILKAATQVTIEAPDTVVTGNFQVQGETDLTETVRSDGTNISSTHTHPQGNDSDGDAQQDTGFPQ